MLPPDPGSLRRPPVGRMTAAVDVELHRRRIDDGDRAGHADQISQRASITNGGLNQLGPCRLAQQRCRVFPTDRNRGRNLRIQRFKLLQAWTVNEIPSTLEAWTLLLARARPLSCSPRRRARRRRCRRRHRNLSCVISAAFASIEPQLAALRSTTAADMHLPCRRRARGQRHRGTAPPARRERRRQRAPAPARADGGTNVVRLH
jgi:hypothetical protein